MQQEVGGGGGRRRITTGKSIFAVWPKYTAKAEIGLGELFAETDTRQRCLGDNRLGDAASPSAFCRGHTANPSPRQQTRHPAKKRQSGSSLVRWVSGVCQIFAENGGQGTRRRKNAQMAPRVLQLGAGERLRRVVLRRVPVPDVAERPCTTSP